MTEVCVFVIWSAARPFADAILADLQARFALSDVVELTWPPETFGRQLTRFYGEALPPGSDKERLCGTGPFLVAVAVDRHARHGLRRTTSGFRRVNVHAAAAKRRYRRLSGGGFGVHGSLDEHEARRDLRLLFGVDPAAVLDQRWDGAVRKETMDRLEWPSADELVATIAAATPAALVSDDGTRVTVQADDLWWAAVIAGGDQPEPDAREVELDVVIGGQSRPLRLLRR